MPLLKPIADSRDGGRPSLTHGLGRHIVTIRLRYRFALLLSMFLLFILLGPPLAIAERGDLPVSLLMMGVVGAGAWAAAQNRLIKLAMTALVPASLLLTLAMQLRAGPAIALTSMIVDAVVILIAQYMVLRTALRHPQVTADTILGSVCGYMMIGLLFYFAYSALEVFHRGTLLDQGALLRDIGGDVPIYRYLDLLYFSYTTLTTVGYGDIVPVRPFARSLASVEALLGQIYMATLVAFLVGVYITDKSRLFRAQGTTQPSFDDDRTPNENGGDHGGSPL